MTVKGIVFTMVSGITLSILIIVSLSLLFAFPVKWTWNATMPYLFGLPIINWGKAWCLTFLAGSLIKSNYSPTLNKK